MIVQVKIKTELIEWVADQTGMDRVEAEDFTKQFAGMLYFTGAFEGIGPIGPALPASQSVDVEGAQLELLPGAE